MGAADEAPLRGRPFQDVKRTRCALEERIRWCLRSDMTRATITERMTITVSAGQRRARRRIPAAAMRFMRPPSAFR